MYPIPAPGGRVFIGRYLLARFVRGRARHPSPAADLDTPRRGWPRHPSPGA